MPRGYRRIIIAAVAGLSLFGLGYGYGEIERHTPDPYAGQRYQPARDLAPPPYAKDPKVAPDAYQPGCGEPGNREDADLCAQWAAVHATTEANRLTRLSIYVTAFEFMALIGSLFFTGWAAIAAARAARSAQIATDSFLKSEEGKLVFAIVDNTLSQGENCWDLIIAFTNVGRTAAVVRKLYVAYDFSRTDDDPFEKGAMFGVARSEVIAPGAVRAVGKAELTVRTGQVLGYLTYDDIFGNRHESYFRLGFDVDQKTVEPAKGRGDPESY